MLVKRVLAGYAIFIASLAAIALLAAMLLSTPAVLAVLAKVFRPEIDFAPVISVLGLLVQFGVLLGIVLLGIGGMIRQEMNSPFRRSRTNDGVNQAFAVGDKANPQPRHGGSPRV